jgi:serine/threonine protein phosphatase PrpC
MTETSLKTTNDKNNFHKSHIANHLDNSQNCNKTKQPVLAKDRHSDKQLASERSSYRVNPSLSLFKHKADRVQGCQSKNKCVREKTQEDKPAHYEISSIKGTKEVNQDTIKTGDNVWIVCDGHGEHGHTVSWFVANTLFESFQERTEKEKCSKALLMDLFSAVESGLEESGIDIRLSGSTCVMVVLTEDKVFCACLGDSVAVAVYEDQHHELLSAEHKPSNPEEAKRIEFTGGVVRKTPGKEHLPFSPLRIWGQGTDEWGPGLAISRSFGDKMAQRYGLIYEPSVL